MNDGFSERRDEGDVPFQPQIPETDPAVLGPVIGNGNDVEEQPEPGYEEVPADVIGTGFDLEPDPDPEGTAVAEASPLAEGFDTPTVAEAVSVPGPHIEYRGETATAASGFPRTDLYDRVHSLGVPLDELVVVASGVIEAVVGPDVRRAADLDATVTEGVYRHLRTRPGMEEVVGPDGEHRLVGNGIDVGMSWAGKTVNDLQTGGFTNEGVPFAGLPEVYEAKEARGEPKDVRDLEIIRNRLYGDRPLPLGMLKGETEFLESFVPEHLHGHPALHVGANGLYIVRTRFGVEDRSVRTYSGTVEQSVPATFHAWRHSALGTRDGQRNMDVANAEARLQGRPEPFNDRHRLSHAAGYPNHDAKIGDGRQAINPENHDELQCAGMTVSHLEAVGVTDEELLEESHATVMATTFSEARKAQDIAEERGHILSQETGAGSDMAPFRRDDAAVNAARLVPEDFSRVGAGWDEPFTRLTNELNANREPDEPLVRVHNAEDGMRLVDDHPDFPVTRTNADGTTETMPLREAAARHLEGSADFMEKYEFPSSWRLGSKATQLVNAGVARAAAARIRAGESAVEVLHDLEDYARRGSV